MRHVDHQIGANLVRDRAEAGKIDDPRIGTAARDDEPRLMLFGLPLDLVVIDARILGAHAIADGMKPFA